MVRLLAALDHAQPGWSYVHHLLAAAAERRREPGGEPRVTSASAPGGMAPHVLVEPLSKRELDVLRLLASELDGPSIARELVVSLNTVRTHTRNIYTKLGVNNRRAAVRRAHQLELLS